MYGEPHLQVASLERRNGNACGSQFGEGVAKPSEILRIAEDRQIGVAAKLRCAV